MILTDPSPYLPRRLPGERFQWKAVGIFEDTIDIAMPEVSFLEVFTRRRTRTPAGLLPIPNICAMIRNVMQVQLIGTGSFLCRAKTKIVSAGALQSLSVIIVTANSFPIVYDAATDKFLLLDVRDLDQLSKFKKSIHDVLPDASGTILLVAADMGVIESIYCEPISLVLREAGAVMQVFSMLSHSLQVAFVPLGPLGNGGLEAIVSSGTCLQGVGTALIGQAASFD